MQVGLYWSGRRYDCIGYCLGQVNGDDINMSEGPQAVFFFFLLEIFCSWFIGISQLMRLRKNQFRKLNATPHFATVLYSFLLSLRSSGTAHAIN